MIIKWFRKTKSDTNILNNFLNLYYKWNDIYFISKHKKKCPEALFFVAQEMILLRSLEYDKRRISRKCRDSKGHLPVWYKGLAWCDTARGDRCDLTIYPAGYIYVPNDWYKILFWIS